MMCIFLLPVRRRQVTKKTGFKENTDTSVTTGKWTVPVGKFKETEFFVKISK